MQLVQFRFRKKIAKRSFLQKTRLRSCRELHETVIQRRAQTTAFRQVSRGQSIFQHSEGSELFRFVDFFAFGSVSEFSQRPEFELSDSLLGHTEFLADLFESARLGALT